MALGKKGIFFTIMAFFFLGLLLLYFFNQQPVQIRKAISGAGKSSVKTRIILLNDHVKNLDESLLTRALRVSGKAAMLSLMDDAVRKDSYVVDLNRSFTEILRNGTINGIDLTTEGIFYMVNNTFDQHIRDIINATNGFLNVQSDVSIGKVWLFQDNDTGPWQYGIMVDISYWLRDDTASWNYTRPILVAEDILGFHDLPYRLELSSNRSITKTNITSWNVNETRAFIGQRSFRSEEQAPSFLMRLSGQANSSSCCGIESLVPPNTPLEKNMSYVDYCYFFESCPGSTITGNYSLYNVTSITNSSYHFLLEPYHISLERYNVSAYAYSWR
ncbi:MAG: hypothetical protein GXP63_04625 [DPANN group archaeon]|nr:hypothetical protein [DPANN group archaeon]